MFLLLGFLIAIKYIALILFIICAPCAVLVVADMALYIFREEKLEKKRTVDFDKTIRLYPVPVPDPEYVKARVRAQKERDAYEGFFEEGYVSSFNPDGTLKNRVVRVPTPKALAFYRAMDRLADTEIFNNTEELRNDFC